MSAPDGFEYEPDGPVLERFLESRSFVKGILGPVRSGKTTACVVDLLDRGINQAPGPDNVRRRRTVAVRNTYGELRTTTVKSWEQWVDPAMGRVNTSARPLDARLRYRLEDGTQVDHEWLFLALDRDEDVRKLLSLEVSDAWIHEAREVPRQVVMRMTERVDQFPPRRDGGATFPGIVMDTNPPDDEHWWYRLAEVETPASWAFFRQPSGRSTEAENIRNLVPGYYERACEGKSVQEIRVYIDGQYGYVEEGRRVFEDYQDWLHCGDKELEPDPSLPLYVGLDFGWSAAAAFAQRDPLVRWNAIDELVSEDLTTGRFAEAVKRKLDTDYAGFRIAGVFGDPSGQATSPLVSEDQPNTHIDICRAAGLPVAPAATNDVRLRIEATARPLRRFEGGRPGLMVSRRAVQLRKGFNGRYRYPKRTVGGGDEAYAEKPVKNLWSHPMDALQAILVSAGEGREAIKVHRERPAPRPKTPRRHGYLRGRRAV